MIVAMLNRLSPNCSDFGNSFSISFDQLQVGCPRSSAECCSLCGPDQDFLRILTSMFVQLTSSDRTAAVIRLALFRPVCPL